MFDVNSLTFANFQILNKKRAPFFFSFNLFLKVLYSCHFVCVLNLGFMSIAICAVWNLEFVITFIMFLARFIFIISFYTILYQNLHRTPFSFVSFLYSHLFSCFLFYLTCRSLVCFFLHCPLGCLNLPARCYSQLLPLLFLKNILKSHTFSVIPHADTPRCPSYFISCFVCYCLACMIKF